MVLSMDNSDESLSEDGGSSNMERPTNDIYEVSTPKQQETMPSSSSTSSNVVRKDKKLDPLVSSLTRMDDETKNAPTIQIPIWGELILDKSLFVLIPVASFAIIGLLTSLYILTNSGDEFVNAVNENAILQSVPTFKPPMSASEASVIEGCRGLCSQQESDLEGLRIFMNSISGKK